METAISILAIVAGIIGIVGSILPALPGPPVSWVGMLVLYIWGSGTNASGEPMSLKVLLIWLVVTIVVSIVDYLVPMYFTKVTGASKYAERGAMAGLIIGIFLTTMRMPIKQNRTFPHLLPTKDWIVAQNQVIILPINRIMYFFIITHIFKQLAISVIGNIIVISSN